MVQMRQIPKPFVEFAIKNCWPPRKNKRNMFLISASTVWNGTATRRSKFFDTNLNFCNLFIEFWGGAAGRCEFAGGRCWAVFFWWDATPILFWLGRPSRRCVVRKKRKGTHFAPWQATKSMLVRCFLRIWINVPQKCFYAVFMGKLNFSQMPVIFCECFFAWTFRLFRTVQCGK